MSNKKVFIIGLICFVCDQVSKILISTWINYGNSIKIIDNFFRLTPSTNTGAAFSILEGKSFYLIIASITIIIILLKYMQDFKETLFTQLSFGLMMGGIFGNLIDRIFFGYVRDFLDFNLFGYNYPIFNLADVSIVSGVFLLIISILRGYDHS